MEARHGSWFRGLTGYQWTILLIAWLGWVFDVMDAAIFNLTKGQMLTSMIGAPAYKLNGPTIEGWIQAFFLLGWAIGGFAFGVVADKWGRTRTLFFTILLYCLFTGLTALCHEPWQVGIARFLTALGIGGEWAAGAALVAEVLPNRARAGAASFIQSAAAFGPMAAALIQFLLKGQAWQWMFIAGILPALLCLVIRYRAKEPERKTASENRSPVRELFAAAKWRRHAVVAMIIGVVGVAGAGTATYWAPNLVTAASQGLSPEVIAARISRLTFLSHLGTLAGVFLVPWLCTVFGRKPTIFAFFLAAPLALLIGLTNPTYDKIVLVMPMVNFFAIGVSASFVLYFPELFPTRMRATGAGLAYNTGRIFAIPIPILAAALIQHFGGAAHGGVATAMVLSGGLYVVGLVAVLFAPETKGLALPE